MIAGDALRRQGVARVKRRPHVFVPGWALLGAKSGEIVSSCFALPRAQSIRVPPSPPPESAMD